MIAIIFPGQGSQHPGMGEALYEKYQAAKDIFHRVEAATGIRLAELCFHSDPDTLRQTQNTQIALYTCGLAAYASLQEQTSTLAVQAMAGHSVGEYTALAAAGIITIEDGAKLVQKRGNLMARSGQLRPGAMAAILGLDSSVVKEICELSSSEGEVVIANYNCPGQLVISGDKAAVQLAGELAKDKGAKRVLPLNVSGAFHSPLMDEAAESMREALAQCQFSQPKDNIQVYANTTASKVNDSTSWQKILEEQLNHSVKWTQSIQNMIADDIHSFIECGCGEVYIGLVKRIDKSVERMTVDSPETLNNCINQLKEVSI